MIRVPRDSTGVGVQALLLGLVSHAPTLSGARSTSGTVAQALPDAPSSRATMRLLEGITLVQQVGHPLLALPTSVQTQKLASTLLDTGARRVCALPQIAWVELDSILMVAVELTSRDAQKSHALLLGTTNTTQERAERRTCAQNWHAMPLGLATAGNSWMVAGAMQMASRIMLGNVTPVQSVPCRVFLGSTWPVVTDRSLVERAHSALHARLASTDRGAQESTPVPAQPALLRLPGHILRPDAPQVRAPLAQRGNTMMHVAGLHQEHVKRAEPVRKDMNAQDAAERTLAPAQPQRPQQEASLVRL